MPSAATTLPFRSAVELRGLVDAYLAQIERLVDAVDRLKLEGHWV